MTYQVSINDVAREAGVAKSTVSLVLNGHGKTSRISPATQKRILAVVRQLGYQADPTYRHVALGNPPFYYTERLNAMAQKPEANPSSPVGPVLKEYLSISSAGQTPRP